MANDNLTLPITPTNSSGSSQSITQNLNHHTNTNRNPAYWYFIFLLVYLGDTFGERVSANIPYTPIRYMMRFLFSLWTVPGFANMAKNLYKNQQKADTSPWLTRTIYTATAVGIAPINWMFYLACQRFLSFFPIPTQLASTLSLLTTCVTAQDTAKFNLHVRARGIISAAEKTKELPEALRNLATPQEKAKAAVATAGGLLGTFAPLFVFYPLGTQANEALMKYLDIPTNNIWSRLPGIAMGSSLAAAFSIIYASLTTQAFASTWDAVQDMRTGRFDWSKENMLRLSHAAFNAMGSTVARVAIFFLTQSSLSWLSFLIIVANAASVFGSETLANYREFTAEAQTTHQEEERRLLQN